MGRSISQTQNPAYVRARPTFYIPNAASCAPLVTSLHRRGTQEQPRGTLGKSRPETANPLQPALCLCQLRRFRSVPATQLLDCIRKVIADGAPGQEECASYLVKVCPTVGGRKHLAFSFGQRAHALAKRRRRQARIDDAFALCRAPDGVRELLRRCVLEQEA